MLIVHDTASLILIEVIILSLGSLNHRKHKHIWNRLHQGIHLDAQAARIVYFVVDL